MRTLNLLALPLALSLGLGLAAPTSAATKKTDAATTTKTRSAAQMKSDQKMKDCGAKWRGLSAPDKAKYDTKGKSMKDKNGKPESGWIVYSVECRKA